MFPTSRDEANAAFQFFVSKTLSKFKVTNLAVLRNDDSEYSRQCAEYTEELLKSHEHNFTYSVPSGVVSSATKFILEHPEFDGFFILGGVFNAHDIAGHTVYVLMNSQVTTPAGSGVILNPAAKNVTYRLVLSPPMLGFASTSALRTEYSTWVSSADQDAASFQSFFVGKFLSQVIDFAKESNPNTTLTADNIIDAVYKRSVFSVAGVQIGPFKDSCSSSRDCNNQGLSTVYVVKGVVGQKISRTYVIGDYGRDYIPLEKAAVDDNLKMVLGLAIGVGGGAVLCVLIISIVIWRTRRTVEFFNIHKGEIELGKCLGNGRFGAMYMADWHGTTVAVRVIDKKAAPKEDQRLIKEEVLLLHKHHHPNLLMLMGYCETKTELLVVTEYMEGGTLADFLRKEKRTSEVYTLVAMAFDVLKGIAYLHSCKPPIVHGSISSRNLLLDTKGTVKVSDFWFSNKKGAFSSTGSGKSQKRAAWQPPEVIAGTILTPATDVYSFGIVLWELIAPADMTQSASGTGSEGLSAQSSSSAPIQASMLASVSGGAEMRSAQLGPPEIPPNASPEVADLLERCWKTQPERRPSIFQILRNWPNTFASLGAFEIPQDLLQNPSSYDGSSCAAGQYSSNSTANAMRHVDLNEDMSMVSFMPLTFDSVALQTPGDPTGLAAMGRLPPVLPTAGRAPPSPVYRGDA
eukprot:m51a1_g8832 putative pas domain-containing protein tyrosine kinase (687) ;mRNA; r:397567-399959